MTSKPPSSSSTAAFYLQSVIAFGISLTAMVVALWQMSADPWIRAFLGLGTVFLVSSSFTLAKCVRDRQDANSVIGRVDQARLEKLLAEHDPFTKP
jgi:hypothetical protein